MQNEDVTYYIQGWEPEGKPKAIVCLIHGLGDHTGRFERVGKALNGAGYALFGFDMRGHGQTGGPRGHVPSLDIIMQDIHLFVDLQKQNHPNLPVFLYGHSLGGMLTLTYAIQFGEELKGVIASSAGLRSPVLEQKPKVALVNLLGSLVPGMIITTGLDPNTISRDPNVIQKYLNDPLVHDKTSLGLARASFKAIDLCFTRAKELKPPLLLMHGTADMGTYPRGSEEFARLASETNKDVTLKLWDGLYHELHNEPEKADVFKFMIDWLDGHL